MPAPTLIDDPSCVDLLPPFPVLGDAACFLRDVPPDASDMGVSSTCPPCPLLYNFGNLEGIARRSVCSHLGVHDSTDPGEACSQCASWRSPHMAMRSTPSLHALDALLGVAATQESLCRCVLDPMTNSGQNIWSLAHPPTATMEAGAHDELDLRQCVLDLQQHDQPSFLIHKMSLLDAFKQHKRMDMSFPACLLQLSLLSNYF